MNWLFGQQRASASDKGVVAAIGNFDGIHRGHQALLTALREKSIEEDRPSWVILFEPQPAEYFYPESAPARLTSLREKLAFIARFQIDTVVCLRFNTLLAKMDAQDFADHYLFGSWNVQSLLIGRDFRFGAARKGNGALLQQMAASRNATVQIFDDVWIQGARVSSTRVRAALACADFSCVERLLGRTYSLSGRVVRGAGLGRQWGIPTANIRIGRRRAALQGVFCVSVLRASGERLSGVANLGYRPSVDGLRMSLEVHLLGCNVDVYAERLQVFFLHKLRDEIKFDSLDVLFGQIEKDIQAALLFFKAFIPVSSL